MVVENRPLLPPIFLKSYFNRNVFLEICFCVTLQNNQDFFDAGTPRILLGTLEKFQIYGVTITGRYICEPKNGIFLFLLIPPSNTLHQAGTYPFHWNSTFWKSIFPPAQSGDDFGAEKMTKIKPHRVLVTGFDIFHHLCNI